jgi:twitching motility two-component system response regulator PilH
MSTLLVVDDSPTQRRMIADLLRANAFEIMTAKDGLEALELIQETQPDLVVLDIVMPRLNGYEVCRRLKANLTTRQLPIIFCSSNSTEVNRYWGLKQGAAAYVSKPFRPEELVETVKQVLSKL